MHTFRTLSLIAIGSLLTHHAFAWGPDGHQSVGAIADTLIANTRAQTEVKAILVTLSLSDASVWADCAKGVDPKMDFEYTAEGQYAECRVFETPDGEAEMSDFVRRNSTCIVKPGDEICNKQYHYTDVNIAQPQYQLGLVGTRDDGIVGAIAAAVHFLKGDPAPTPFSFKDKHQALLALVHYVGDVHQPLHVGAVYLTTNGKRVNPDISGFDRKTFTTGGNALLVNGVKLHKIWDDIPDSMKVAQIDANWILEAKAVPTASGNLFSWPASWATESLHQAQSAFQGVTFGPLKNKHWATTLPAGYSPRMDSIKKPQLTAAGAHLGQL